MINIYVVEGKNKLQKCRKENCSAKKINVCIKKLNLKQMIIIRHIHAYFRNQQWFYNHIIFFNAEFDRIIYLAKVVNQHFFAQLKSVLFNSADTKELDSFCRKENLGCE